MQNSKVTLYTRQVLDKTSLLGSHPREMKAILTQNLHLKVYSNFFPSFLSKPELYQMFSNMNGRPRGGSDTQHAKRHETESGTQYFTKVHSDSAKDR